MTSEGAFLLSYSDMLQPHSEDRYTYSSIIMSIRMRCLIPGLVFAFETDGTSKFLYRCVEAGLYTTSISHWCYYPITCTRFAFPCFFCLFVWYFRATFSHHYPRSWRSLLFLSLFLCSFPLLCLISPFFSFSSCSLPVFFALTMYIYIFLCCFVGVWRVSFSGIFSNRPVKVSLQNDHYIPRAFLYSV